MLIDRDECQMFREDTGDRKSSLGVLLPFVPS